MAFQYQPQVEVQLQFNGDLQVENIPALHLDGPPQVQQAWFQSARQIFIAEHNQNKLIAHNLRMRQLEARDGRQRVRMIDDVDIPQQQAHPKPQIRRHVSRLQPYKKAKFRGRTATIDRLAANTVQTSDDYDEDQHHDGFYPDMA